MLNAATNLEVADRRNYVQFNWISGSSAMAQTNFVVDANTAQLLQDLQATFGVTNNAAVIRRALGLAKIAARHAGPLKTVTIKGSEGEEETVLLAD